MQVRTRPMPDGEWHRVEVKPSQISLAGFECPATFWVLDEEEFGAYQTNLFCSCHGVRIVIGYHNQHRFTVRDQHQAGAPAPVVLRRRPGHDCRSKPAQVPDWCLFDGGAAREARRLRRVK